MKSHIVVGRLREQDQRARKRPRQIGESGGGAGIEAGGRRGVGDRGPRTEGRGAGPGYFDPRTPILDPRISILDPRSSLIDPRDVPRRSIHRHNVEWRGEDGGGGLIAGRAARDHGETDPSIAVPTVRGGRDRVVRWPKTPRDPRDPRPKTPRDPRGPRPKTPRDPRDPRPKTPRDPRDPRPKTPRDPRDPRPDNHAIRVIRGRRHHAIRVIRGRRHHAIRVTRGRYLDAVTRGRLLARERRGDDDPRQIDRGRRGLGARVDRPERAPLAVGSGQDAARLGDAARVPTRDRSHAHRTRNSISRITGSGLPRSDVAVSRSTYRPGARLASGIFVV